MPFLASDAKPNVLMEGIIPDNIVWPDIISLGYNTIFVVERDVISVCRRGRWLHRPRWTFRDTCAKSSEADDADKD
jgi:hypothetical protein